VIARILASHAGGESEQGASRHQALVPDLGEPGRGELRSELALVGKRGIGLNDRPRFGDTKAKHHSPSG
jgi:hypothetical protein